MVSLGMVGKVGLSCKWFAARTETHSTLSYNWNVPSDALEYQIGSAVIIF